VRTWCEFMGVVCNTKLPMLQFAESCEVVCDVLPLLDVRVGRDEVGWLR
jgi:hypothetical protein